MRIENFCVSIHINGEPIHFLSLFESSERICNQIFYFSRCFFTLFFHRNGRVLYRILKFVVYHRILFLFLSFFSACKGFYFLQNVILDIFFPFFTLLFCIRRIHSFFRLQDQLLIFIQIDRLRKNVLSHFIDLIYTLVEAVNCQFIENQIPIVEVVIQFCIVLFEFVDIRL